MEYKSDPLPTAATSDTLVVYQFFQKDESYVDNFLHFLVEGYDEANDHVVVVAGPCTIALPRLRKLRYLFTENKNHDYGGYCEVVNNCAAIFDYERVFFVNSSVRGPFVPPMETRKWTQIFRDKLVDGVGLVGSSINILTGPVADSYQARHGGQPPYSHVQTMAYCLPRAALRSLHARGFYAITQALPKQEVIEEYEVRLSQWLLSECWDIACLLPEYDAIDYRQPHAEINPTSVNGDPSHPNGYFGRSAHPYEVMFVKTNRGIFTEAYLDRLALSTLDEHALAHELREQPLVRARIDRLLALRGRRDAVPLTETRLTPAEILNFARALMARHPQFRGELQAIARDASPAA